MNRKLLLGAAVPLVFIASASAVPSWTTDSYKPADWTPADESSNLLRLSGTTCTTEPNYYTENGKDMTNDPATLTDGAVPNGMDYSQVCGIAGGSIAWSFDEAKKLDAIAIFTRWGDGGRDGIAVTQVDVQYADQTDWTKLESVPAVSYGLGNNDSAGKLKAVLANGSDSLAEGIVALRLQFSGQDNSGTGYVEIEAVGSPYNAPKFTLEPATVGKRTAVLNGTVTSSGAADKAELYFAYGKSESLTPVATGRTFAKDDPLDITLDDLDDGTTYYYSAYFLADGVRSSLIAGSFTTVKELYRNLPAEYTQVLSLTSSGGAYIATDLATTTMLTAELDFIPLVYTGDANVGSQTNDGADWRFFNYNGGSMFDVGAGRIGMNNQTLLQNGTRYLVSFGLNPENTANQFLEIVRVSDGERLYRGEAGTNGSVQNGEKVYLFGGKNGSGANTTDMTLYSFVIWSEGAKVGDFVPCRRNSDEALGLYDTVSSTFYPNANSFGTAKFEAGDVVPAPDAPLSSLTVTDLQKWEATVQLTVEKFGGSGTAGDLYFAWGERAADLVPVKVAEGLSLGATHSITLTDLNDSTTYAYAYYLVNNAGERQSTVTGSFTTLYAEPATTEATVGYYSSHELKLTATVTALGEQATTADLLFAVGTTPSGQDLAVHTANVTLNEPIDVFVDELTPGTTYYWTLCAVNDLHHTGPRVSGSFTTFANDGNPKWVGRVSSDWSDPDNWDPIAELTDYTAYGTVVLNGFPEGHNPTNVDLTELDIKTLTLGSGFLGDMTISGKGFKLKELKADPAAHGTLTIVNPVTVKGTLVNNMNNGNCRVTFAGVVGQDPVADAIVDSPTCGNVAFTNPNNTFEGAKIGINLGSFQFTSDGALGVPPTEKPTSATLFENFGELRTYCLPDKHYNLVSLSANRYLQGSLVLEGNVDVDFAGVFGNWLDFGNGGTTADHVRRVRLSGESIPAEAFQWHAAQEIGVANQILLELDSNKIASDGTRYISSSNGGLVDLNGQNVALGLSNYSCAYNQNPCFNNNNTERAVTQTGPVRLGYDYNTTYFGGLGDITLNCTIDQDANERQFAKRGAGRLTFGDVTSTWKGWTTLLGPVTLDYAAKNAPKLGNNKATIGFGEFRVKGHPTEATMCELAEIHPNGGLTPFVLDAGAAGLTAKIDYIGALNARRAIDFTPGANGTFDVSGFTNIAEAEGFGALHPNLTYNGGETWAAVAEGKIVPMPAAALTSVTGAEIGEAEENKVLDITSSSTAFTKSMWVNGIRFSGTAGTTLDLGEKLVTVRKIGGQQPMAWEAIAGILVSKDCGGDVVILNGDLRPQEYNSGLAIHNYNTHGTLRISARLRETNANDLSIFGPGMTILDNDDNGFYYGPQCFGGGTVKFTSIADGRTNSALGRGVDGIIESDDGAVYEYIGTKPEGHASNRRFNARGTLTLKANGAGPLVLNGQYAVSSSFGSSRLILDGDGEGVLDGIVSPGTLGSVVKRGTGTWTMNSAANTYEYATVVEAGTLVVGGVLPSDVIVKAGATLQLKPGALIKRALTLEPGATLVYDNAAGTEPATVWGAVALNGTLALTRRVKAADGKVTVLASENGVTGAFTTLPGGLRPPKKAEDGEVAFESPNGFVIIIK